MKSKTLSDKAKEWYCAKAEEDVREAVRKLKEELWKAPLMKYKFQEKIDKIFGADLI